MITDLVQWVEKYDFLFCNVILKCIPLKRTESTFIKQKLTDSTPSLFQILIKHFPRCDFIQLFHTNLSSIYYYCETHIFENLTSTIFCQRMLCLQEKKTHTQINALNWWTNSSLLLVKLNWLITKRTSKAKTDWKAIFSLFLNQYS